MPYQPKVTRELSGAGQNLVDVYNSVPGSSGPYANPESLAGVVKHLAVGLFAANPNSKEAEVCASVLLDLSENFFK